MITSLQLRNAGFSEDQITYWVDQQRGTLKKAGFSDMEINKEYGLRINQTDDLNHIVNDTDTSLSLNINKENSSNIQKSESKNKVVSKQSVDTVNSLIDKNIEDRKKYQELSKEDQMNISTMLSYANIY